MTEDKVSPKSKLSAIYQAGRFRPLYSVGIVALSVVTALLEGIGISFILPIFQLAGESGNPTQVGGLLQLFVSIYRFFGIPFTLGYLVGGVCLIITVRYTTSFIVGWLRAAIEAQYVRYLQIEIFSNTLRADIAYFDQEGSDEILNAIVTQTEYAGRVIQVLVRLIEQSILSAIYLSVAFVIAPRLTVLAMAFFGIVTLTFRKGLTGGYSIGSQVADANEQIQEAAQEGTQGIRDIKLFGMSPEIFSGFKDSADKFAKMYTILQRNQQAIQNFYELAVALTLFILIYIALTFMSISLGALGVFLFAIFRLGPKMSSLNQMAYNMAGDLPHLVRTQKFVEELKQNAEKEAGSTDVPKDIDKIAFEKVSFSYKGTDGTLRNITFAISSQEFVAFVGPSGAGKSTIAALLARLYAPDSGQITANGTPISEFNIKEWRSRVSVVRQRPYIFNDTLQANVTIGKREASNEEIARICEIARVDEFVNELPEGYETVLGDDGVKLSGGQRQRVAIARALISDADILILDEATSDLDSALEREIHTNIEGMDRDYAILVIAHRLSTITNADTIYTLSNGEIVQRGTHQTLLGEEGMYSDLYEAQS